MIRVLLAATWLLTGHVMAANLSIVVDDLGYSLERAERVLALPGPVTVALLPFAPATADIAQRARETGHEIIVHQPMEPLPGEHVRLAPGTLTVGMSAERFVAQMDAALAAVPGSVGINNHTGSLLTQDAVAMRRLMNYLAAHDLLFLDSRTTPLTVAYRVAREARVPAVARDVFLDHVPEQDAMAAAFERALCIAGERGHAVLIAHPHAASIEFLERALTDLPAQVSLVSLRRLTGPDPVIFARRQSPGSRYRSLGQ